MENIINGLMPISIIAAFAVAVILALGLWNMMRGGSPNKSQKLMRMRVILQLIAIALVMGSVYLASIV